MYERPRHCLAFLSIKVIRAGRDGSRDDDFQLADGNWHLISAPGGAANEHGSAMKSRLHGYACPRARASGLPLAPISFRPE